MSVASDSTKHGGVGTKEIHKARTSDRQGIVHGRVLECVRDHYHGCVVDVDYVYAERCVSWRPRARRNCRQRWIIERSGPENLRLLNAAVVYLDLAGPEIGGQEKTAGRIGDQRQAFVNRARGGGGNRGIVHR